MTYRDISNQIKNKKVRSLYLLYGEESFLLDRLVQDFIESLIIPEVRDMNVVQLDGSQKKITLNQLKDEVQTLPFLSPLKLLIVKNSDFFATRKNSTAAKNPSMKKDTENEDFIKFLANLPNEICLIFVEKSVDGRQKKKLAAVDANGVRAEIKIQDETVLLQWISLECKRKDLLIQRKAALSLIDRTQKQMRLIHEELQKIFLYCAYLGQDKITEADIEFLCMPDIGGRIFDLTDALSIGETEKALIILQHLLAQKEPIQMLQFMLTRHFRQLIVAADLRRENEIIAKLKVRPFVAKRLTQQAKLFREKDIEILYRRCVAMDIAVKTGKMADQLGLELLILEAGSIFRSCR